MRKPKSTPVPLAAVLLLIGAVTAGLLWAGGRQRTVIGGAFSLVDGAGHVVTDATFRGRFMLVYFGYTFCPDICPTTLAQMAGALDRLGAASVRVQPVFITVDPAHDTPEVMAHFTAAIDPRLLGLTGSPASVAAAERAFRIHAAADPASGTIDHSAVIYLMGPDGALLAPIPADTPVPRLAADIARHLS